MRKPGILLVLALSLGLLNPNAQATGEIKGLMFGEYYYVVNHHDKEIEDQNGFWFRRIYLTYDNKLSDKIKMRLRFEMNSPGDFKSAQKLTAVVKDAYLSFDLRGQEMMIGLIPTPTKTNIENIWGYRAVEKTPLDLQKLLYSRDFGISIKGNFDKAKTVFYWLMFGNGSSNEGETDRGKKIYAQLGFRPHKGLYLEAYGDYEAQKDDKTYYVYQGFVSYEDDWGRIGALYGRRHFNQREIDYDFDIFSGFAVIKATEDLEIIGRFDRMFGDGFENHYSGHKISYIPFAENPGAPFNLIIVGISWQLAQNVWIIPNIKYVFYDKPNIGESLSDSIYANMTLWFKF